MPPMIKPRLPNNSQRIAVIGSTGTGKTQAAMYHLSRRNFDSRPWIVFDFKTDKLINDVAKARHIDLGEVPKKPGIYVVHPMPDQEKEIDSYLWKIWERENIGVYVDEGYMMGNSPAFNTLLTQGRSKTIPMIVLSQRPVWMSRFVFSESDFYQIFRLNDKRDRQTIQSFAPVNLEQLLPEYHSHYYDVGRNQLFHFGPVPTADELLETIDAKLKTGFRKI